MFQRWFLFKLNSCFRPSTLFIHIAACLRNSPTCAGVCVCVVNFGKLVLLNPFVSQLPFVLPSVCGLVSPRFVNPAVVRMLQHPHGFCGRGCSGSVFPGAEVVSRTGTEQGKPTGPALEHTAHVKMGSGASTPWKTKYLHVSCACTPCSSVIPLR